MSLEFFEDNHTFLLDGEPIPSVTEILRPLQADSFAAINPAVLKAAADRGTAVHEITEAMDYDMDYEEMLSPDLYPYADAYDDFLMEHEVEWLGIETPVHFFDQYAGIVDRFGYVDGDLSVVDIKTVRSPTAEQKASVCCQLYAYDRAVRACFPELQGKHMAHYALYLKKDGSYKLMDCRDWEADRSFRPWDVWQELYNARTLTEQAKERVSKTKGKKK